MSSSTPPGWFKDPWGQYTWRWWDGHSWTTYGSSSTKGKPHLANWISPLIILSLVPTALVIVSIIVSNPLGLFAVLLGLVPLLVLIPALIWLDRVEPEPKGSLIHAFLWGASFSIIVAGFLNEVVSFLFGSYASMVLSAPLGEEALKGAALIFCLKRLEIDGPQDGIIYAFWAGLGFATVENMLYFGSSLESGDLAATFVTRAVLSFYAHPLFTMWIGLFVGLAVLKKKNVLLYGFFGYIIAVFLHMIWNGSLVLDEFMQSYVFALISFLLFSLLFIAVLVSLLVVRSKTKKRFAALLPVLVSKYGLTDYEYVTFSSWSNLIRARAKIPRKNRWRFDNLHSAIARLSLLQDRPGGPDVVHEQILVRKLNEARLDAS